MIKGPPAVPCSELGVSPCTHTQERPLQELLLLFESLSLYLSFFAVSLVFESWLGDGGSYHKPGNPSWGVG